MMFASRNTLAIVTCTGQAWVLSQPISGVTSYGDGATVNATNNALWHRVNTAANTPLADVVAVRGDSGALMALTTDGSIYTWGFQTYINDGNGPSNRTYATLMNKPAGVTPKMIGMAYSDTRTSHAYYLLGTNGKLYAMGANDMKQLGNGTTTDSNTWIQVSASNTISGTTYTMGNVLWFSPTEHDGDGRDPAINIIDENSKLWAWGSNNSGLIAGSNVSTGALDPTYMPGRTSGAYNIGKLNLSDKLLAVETGGHTSITIKECSPRFGYVGHQQDGSMENNSGNGNEYNYSDTGVISLCNAVSAPIVKSLKMCPGTTANLADAEPSSLPTGATGINWWTDQTATTAVTNPAAVGPGTYYATFAGITRVCPASMNVSYYISTDPEYASCPPLPVTCYKPGITTGTALDTKVGISALGRAGATDTDNWPMVRKGGWISLEGKTKGFVPNRVAFDASGNPVGIVTTNFVEGMMVYDTTNKCLKVYTLKEGATTMAWHCVITQACPD